MKEYIEREAVNKLIDREIDLCNSGMIRGELEYLKAIVPIAADVVGLDVVAEMLYVSCGCDECPCNYGPTDEWLPEVCDLQDECPNPKDKLGCWKQYIKHFAERPEYLRGAHEREVDH